MITKRGVSWSEYHTNKVLEAISESNIWVDYLRVSVISSNYVIVSDSEG